MNMTAKAILAGRVWDEQIRNARPVQALHFQAPAPVVNIPPFPTERLDALDRKLDLVLASLDQIPQPSAMPVIPDVRPALAAISSQIQELINRKPSEPGELVFDMKYDAADVIRQIVVREK